MQTHACIYIHVANRRFSAQPQTWRWTGCGACKREDAHESEADDAAFLKNNGLACRMKKTRGTTAGRVGWAEGAECGVCERTDASKVDVGSGGSCPFDAAAWDLACQCRISITV